MAGRKANHQTKAQRMASVDSFLSALESAKPITLDEQGILTPGIPDVGEDEQIKQAARIVRDILVKAYVNWAEQTRELSPSEDAQASFLGAVDASSIICAAVLRAVDRMEMPRVISSAATVFEKCLESRLAERALNSGGRS
jgi:hypothetical protein